MMTNLLPTQSQWPVNNPISMFQGTGQMTDTQTMNGPGNSPFLSANSSLATETGCWSCNPMQMMLQTLGKLVSVVQMLVEKLFSALGIQTGSTSGAGTAAASSSAASQGLLSQDSSDISSSKESTWDRIGSIVGGVASIFTDGWGGLVKKGASFISKLF